MFTSRALSLDCKFGLNATDKCRLLFSLSLVIHSGLQTRCHSLNGCIWLSFALRLSLLQQFVRELIHAYMHVICTKRLACEPILSMYRWMNDWVSMWENSWREREREKWTMKRDRVCLLPSLLCIGACGREWEWEKTDPEWNGMKWNEMEWRNR